MENINDRQHKPLLGLTRDRDAFLKSAVEADDGCVSVGGLAHQLGMLNAPAGDVPQDIDPGIGAGSSPERRLLSEFVELSRREKKLTVEAFAAEANVGVDEVLFLEDPAGPRPEPRVIFNIARYLKADLTKLKVLAGHTISIDSTLEQEAIRIAACVAGSKPLDKDEQRLLREIATILLES